jgi:hypothetical protein
MLTTAIAALDSLLTSLENKWDRYERKKRKQMKKTNEKEKKKTEDKRDCKFVQKLTYADECHSCLESRLLAHLT